MPDPIKTRGPKPRVALSPSDLELLFQLRPGDSFTSTGGDLVAVDPPAMGAVAGSTQPPAPPRPRLAGNAGAAPGPSPGRGPLPTLSPAAEGPILPGREVPPEPPATPVDTTADMTFVNPIEPVRPTRVDYGPDPRVEMLRRIVRHTPAYRALEALLGGR